MSDRWDDRDRNERDRGWSEGRDRDYDRERRHRSVLSGRDWEDSRQREQPREWSDRDRDRDRGWGSGWGQERDRWAGERDAREWDRHREGGRSLTIGRGELVGEGREDDRRRWDERDREERAWRADDRRDREDRGRWGRSEHFGDRDRNYGATGDAPTFTGAGGTWSAGHSGAVGHEATGGMSSWSGRDRGYEDRERRGNFAGRGPKNYRRADDRICEDANDRLTRHPDVDASDVDVTVKEGEVTLSGVVDTRHERRAAEDVVWEVWGVREVHNNLKVQSREERGVLDKVADAFRGDNR